MVVRDTDPILATLYRLEQNPSQPAMPVIEYETRQNRFALQLFINNAASTALTRYEDRTRSISQNQVGVGAERRFYAVAFPVRP